jgi:ribosome-associated protein
MQTKESTELLLQKVIEGIQEKKGRNIVVADLTAIEDCICRYFVICEGNSPNQVSAITTSVKDYVKKNAYTRPLSIDGTGNAQWVAMDYGDVVVHVFLPEIRKYYQLENLWNDAKLSEIADLD